MTNLTHFPHLHLHLPGNGGLLPWIGHSLRKARGQSHTGRTVHHSHLLFESELGGEDQWWPTADVSGESSRR